MQQHSQTDRGQYSRQPSSDAGEIVGARTARTAASTARNYRDESGSDGEDDPSRARPQRAATKRQKGKKSSRRSSPEEDDSGDETADEPSSQGSDSASGAEEEFGGSDDGDAAYSAKQSSHARKGKEREVRGTRRSNRETAQAKKTYTFDGSDADDDDSRATSEVEPERTTTTRSGRVSKRGGMSASASASEQYKDLGNSSDELSIQAGSRASSDAAKRAARAAAEESEDDELVQHSVHAETDHPTRPQDLHRGVSASFLTPANFRSGRALLIRTLLFILQSCAKCDQEATDILLERLAARRLKKRPGRKRKRDVLEEDTDAEQDRVEKLGAWVQCGVW